MFEKFISDANIELAIKNASRGKRKRKSVKRRLENPNFKAEIKYYATHFINRKHNPKQIYDGIQRKKRTIIVPAFDEQVIHHMLINVLKPIFMRGMYQHSYGSIPKRGGLKGKKAIERFIKHHSKSCKYVLKTDIKKYFDSIPHDILIEKLEKIIHDERIMAILREIINVIPVGLPLGFYTSQWLANWYLQGLDHYIKEELHAPFYARYMDDKVIFCSNKRKLHKMIESINEYLKGLGLKLKENWQIFKFDYNGKYRFLDFMGYRFYRNRTTLRKSIMIKLTRKARKIYRKEKVNAFDAKQMISYLGWLKYTDTYNMYLMWVKPIVNFQELKRKVSRCDRSKHKYEILCCC